MKEYYDIRYNENQVLDSNYNSYGIDSVDENEMVFPYSFNFYDENDRNISSLEFEISSIGENFENLMNHTSSICLFYTYEASDGSIRFDKIIGLYLEKNIEKMNASCIRMKSTGEEVYGKYVIAKDKTELWSTFNVIVSFLETKLSDEINFEELNYSISKM